MSKALPAVTHLQVLVLEALKDGDAIGRDLRDRLAGHGVRSTGSAYDQMMGRLEEADLVDGWYEQKLVAGQNIKERRYRITRRGRRALDETRAFYLSRSFMLHPLEKGSRELPKR
jgi:DNA-binding PadR family transcriptional regulator